jgi:hypothetical protein
MPSKMSHSSKGQLAPEGFDGLDYSTAAMRALEFFIVSSDICPEAGRQWISIEAFQVNRPC